jgi:hypothetical protein
MIIQGVTKKTGQERGSRGDKKVFGDDVVLFQVKEIDYLDYVRQSLVCLETNAGVLIQSGQPSRIPITTVCVMRTADYGTGHRVSARSCADVEEFIDIFWSNIALCNNCIAEQ